MNNDALQPLRELAKGWRDGARHFSGSDYEIGKLMLRFSRQLTEALAQIESAQADTPRAEVQEDIALIRREAAQVKTNKTGRKGGQHYDDCTCRRCTDQKIATIEAHAKLASQLAQTRFRDLLQRMVLSAEVYVDADDTITGYRIKTGALHALFGYFAETKMPLAIPTNLPTVTAPPRAVSVDALMALSRGWKDRATFLRAHDRRTTSNSPNKMCAGELDDCADELAALIAGTEGGMT